MKEIINFESELFNLSKVNPLVSRYKLFIAYASEPANNYIFSEEVLNNLAITIKGCPVVAGFMNKEDGSLLGGHEGDIALNENNVPARTPTPIPIGFAAYDVEPWWEDYKDRKYLTTFIYVWEGRFPELSNLSDRKIYQSLEVAVDKENQGKYKIVTEAFALGLCLLENVNPAFENSTIEKFSNENISSEVELLKQEYANFTNQEGLNVEGQEPDTLNKTELSSEEDNSKETEKEGEDVIKEAVEKFSLNADQIREILNNQLSQYKYKCGDYEYRKYWVNTYDDTYVYIEDNEDYKTYRIQYNIVDNVATINMESKEEVIRGNFIPVGEKKEEMSTDNATKIENSCDGENKEDMSSNEYVDNTAMQEMNDKEAEVNKELSEENTKLKEEMSALKEKMSEMEANMAVYMSENTKLQEFKASIEKENKTFEVETTLSDVASVLPSEELDNCRLSAENFTLDNINVWKNEVKAKAFNFSKGIKEKETHMRVAFPTSDKPKKGSGLWD